MAFTLISHGGASLGQFGGTFSSLNTTGADLIAFAVGSYSVGVPASVSDNNSLTWTNRSSHFGGDAGVRVFIASGAGIGRSGHTFTAGGGYIGVYVAAFSGGLTSGDPFDVENGGTNTGASVSTGSVTPSANNALIIAALGDNEVSTGVGTTNLTLLGQVDNVPGNSYGVAMAYEIQTTATARSETFTTSTSSSISAAILALTAAAGGGGGGATPRQNMRRISQAVNRAGTY